MKSVTLHTRYGDETHFVHELDKVILCKTEDGMISVGFMDIVSGLMSEEDLEVLITLDDPEDPEKEDTFHHSQADNTVAHWPDQPQQVSDLTSKQK